MDAKIKIPKGWRELEIGEKIQEGDRLLDRYTLKWSTYKYVDGFISELHSKSIRKK